MTSNLSLLMVLIAGVACQNPKYTHSTLEDLDKHLGEEDAQIVHDAIKNFHKESASEIGSHIEQESADNLTEELAVEEPVNGDVADDGEVDENVTSDEAGNENLVENEDDLNTDNQIPDETSAEDQTDNTNTNVNVNGDPIDVPIISASALLNPEDSFETSSETSSGETSGDEEAIDEDLDSDEEPEEAIISESPVDNVDAVSDTDDSDDVDDSIETDNSEEASEKDVDDASIVEQLSSEISDEENPVVVEQTEGLDVEEAKNEEPEESVGVNVVVENSAIEEVVEQSEEEADAEPVDESNIYREEELHKNSTEEILNNDEPTEINVINGNPILQQISGKLHSHGKLIHTFLDNYSDNQEAIDVLLLSIFGLIESIGKRIETILYLHPSSRF